MSKEIPTQLENPKGLHQRYYVRKLVPNQSYEQGVHSPTNPEFLLEQVDRKAEYFVMRLDEGGKDREHIKACRIGIHAYADAIENHIPELAKDLRDRYPLL
jgi:hypothetical protein